MAPMRPKIARETTRAGPLAQRIVGLCLLCLILAGCAGTPAHTKATKRPPAREPNLAVAASQGLSPGQSRLLSAFMAYYRNWTRVPYRYGGTGKNGIDCSAFVRQAMARVRGLRLPRTTRAQIRRGHAIPRNELRVGDLVFFKTGGKSRHVGIYIGHGRFMHVSTRVGVTISRLDNVYWRRHFWQARRLAAQMPVRNSLRN